MTSFRFNTTRALGLRSGERVHIPNANGQWTPAVATVIAKNRDEETGMIVVCLDNGGSFRVFPMNQVAIPV